MADYTLTAAAQTAGPVAVNQIRDNVICMSGTMTAGYVVLMFRPAGSDTYFPCDSIDVEKFQRVPNASGNGYGYCSAIDIPRSGSVKAVASSTFVGSLTVFMQNQN